jgi:hypothetical protein
VPIVAPRSDQATGERSDGCTTQTAAAGRRVAVPSKGDAQVALHRRVAIAMPGRREGRMGAALRASVLVVLEAAVPTYACFGWDGLGDGPEGTKVPPTQRRPPSASTGCGTPLGVVDTADE